jgi:hypothetical protein
MANKKTYYLSINPERIDFLSKIVWGKLEGGALIFLLIRLVLFPAITSEYYFFSF